MSIGHQLLPSPRVPVLAGHQLGLSVNEIIDAHELISDEFVRCCAVA